MEEDDLFDGKDGRKTFQHESSPLYTIDTALNLFIFSFTEEKMYCHCDWLHGAKWNSRQMLARILPYPE
jgi:hypothetical protein